MGRRTKYFTTEAKRATKYAQAQAYRKTKKGKNARRRENKKRSDQEKASRSTWAGVVVPLQLYTRAWNILRPSFAIHDPGPLLGLWTPPYDFAMPDLDSLPAVSEWGRVHAPAWSSRAAVLSAYQCGEVIDSGSTRSEQWAADSLALEDVEVRVKQEVAERVGAWVRLADAVQDERNREAVDVGLDWGARIIRMLAEEWEIRKGLGAAVYREHHAKGILPWQTLIGDTMRLYNEEAT